MSYRAVDKRFRNLTEYNDFRFIQWYFKYQLRDAEDSQGASEHFFRARKLSHGRRSHVDEIFRAPITCCHIVTPTIMIHPDYLGDKKLVNEYRDLVLFVASFHAAFHAFRVITPFPLPLLQMTRALLILPLCC